jgi:hypothetical protein
VKPRWTLPIAGLGVIGGAFLLTAVLRISPFERNYCPLLVVLALTGGWLLAELVETVRMRMFAASTSSAGAVVSLVLAAIVLGPQLWTYPRRLQERLAETKPADPWLTDGYYCYYAANYQPSAVAHYLLDEQVDKTAYQVYCTHNDTWNLAYYFARAGLSFHGETGSPADRNEAVYAVLPDPPPWRKLANDCGLDEAQVNRFEALTAFGYYRLYQAASQPSAGRAQ